MNKLTIVLLSAFRQGRLRTYHTVYNFYEDIYMYFIHERDS